MKKVLSVAMASAMVLGMGANAFAITYNSGSTNTADWPSNFAFEGSLFVTDKNGDIVEQATTDINSNKAVDFEPGDVIWMPLYADNQKVYTVEGAVEKGTDEVAATTIELKGVTSAVANGEVAINNKGEVLPFSYTDELNKVVYWYGTKVEKTGYRNVELKNGDFTTYLNGRQASGTDLVEYGAKTEGIKASFSNITVNGTDTAGSDKHNVATVNEAIIDSQSITGNQVKASASTTGNGTVTVTLTASDLAKMDTVRTALEGAKGTDVTVTAANSAVLSISVTGFDNGTAASLSANNVVVGTKTTVDKGTTQVKDNVTVKVRLPKVAGTDENAGTIKPDYSNSINVSGTVVSHGHYTGNIDKNWSINLIEKSTGVAELIEKAELYKATAVDYTSYHKYTDEIAPNAVYLKITLEDEWKTTSSETLKYYVYVANNKSNTQKTNEVWVSGKYANTDVREVSFDWTNDASKPGLWKVKEGNGIAVFDFADKAFFSVKMYEGETMYLDLGTAYDKAIAGEMDAEADSFYKFDNTNANFARTGELVIVSDDSSLVPYEIDADGNFVKVDAEYVETYAVAHTNQKVNGFVFNTKQLGNYVLSTEELGEEEVAEEPAVEEPAPAEPVEETPAPETNKPNPNTGAEDFVGLAVSLAVVSVAAAGALALKK